MKFTKLIMSLGMVFTMVSTSFNAMAVENRNYCNTSCVSFQETVHFNTGQTASINMDAGKRNAILEMENQIKKLSGDRGFMACVAGHTDNAGSEASNNDLSIRRARAIGQQLRGFGLAQGIPVRLSGYGSKFPVASNADPAGRAQNRRVVIQYGYNTAPGEKCITAAAAAVPEPAGPRRPGRAALLAIPLVAGVAALMADDDKSTTGTQ